MLSFVPTPFDPEILKTLLAWDEDAQFAAEITNADGEYIGEYQEKIMTLMLSAYKRLFINDKPFKAFLLEQYAQSRSIFSDMPSFSFDASEFESGDGSFTQLGDDGSPLK